MATAARLTWKPPRVTTFDLRPPANPCYGDDDTIFSSFYCKDDNTVYMMLGIADESTRRYARQAGIVILRQDARTAGVSVSALRKGFPAAAQVNVLAHEMAHSLLTVNGVQQWYSRRADRHNVGTAKYDRYGYAHETMADCLSGAVQRVAKRDGGLRMNRFDQWAAQADYAGADPFDDARPKAAPFVYPDVWGSKVYRGYGGPGVRVKAWRAGWSAGAASPDPVGYCVRLGASWKKVPVPGFLR
jgi:predicted metalloprotease